MAWTHNSLTASHQIHLLYSAQCATSWSMPTLLLASIVVAASFHMTAGSLIADCGVQNRSPEPDKVPTPLCLHLSPPTPLALVSGSAWPSSVALAVGGSSGRLGINGVMFTIDLASTQY